MIMLSVVEDVVPKDPDLIPSHEVAQWLLTHINDVLAFVGLRDNKTAQEVVYIIIIALLALAVGFVMKWLILWITRKIISLRNSSMARELLREHTFSKCSHIIPPLVFMALLPFAFTHFTNTLDILMRLVGCYVLIAFAIAVNAIMGFAFNRYDERMNTRNLPTRGILIIAQGAVWCIITILCFSILVDKSPMVLLAGLGAFAAALMLIFKDSILGFVAGIQMSQNDMLHVGDWIVVPSTPANGTVIDVSLTAVKVQNWDNTIVTVPPYTLVSGSFQNWRGMSDSGVRRIMMTFYLDYGTVDVCSDEIVKKVADKYPGMRQYIDTMQKNKDATGDWLVGGGMRPVNGTLETNVGLFRAYLCEYLQQNPHISDNHRVLVRLLQPDINGLPLEIWCWSNTTDWNAYEGIQSAVMEHVMTACEDFGLGIYNVGAEAVTLVPPTPAPTSNRPATTANVAPTAGPTSPKA